jgi:hypothetical protein
MKLNLLPTYVSREGQSRVAWVIATLLIVIGLVGALGLIFLGRKDLNDQTARAKALEPQAALALSTAKQADDVMASASGLDRNLKLSKAMTEHNSVYVDLYRDVLKYMPTFFRVTSVTATPVGESECSVTITGVIKTHQQYADIMLALLRIPDVTNVTRSGYVITDPYVPALTEADRDGRKILPGESNIPSDPMARMEALIARAAAQPSGYMNVSGFGQEEVAKGAMPNWSTVTFVLTIKNRKMQAPDPRGTLSAQPATAAAAPGGTSPMGAPGMPSMGAPGGPGIGGPPPGVASPPAAGSSADDAGAKASKGGGLKGRNKGLGADEE